MGFFPKVKSVLNIDFRKASTAAVHISLILGVAAYCLFGAVTMQFLESPSQEKSVDKRSIPEKTTRVYLGSEVSMIDPGVHECLKVVVANILHRTECSEMELDHLNINNVDSCYQNADFGSVGGNVQTTTEENDVTPTDTPEPTLEEEVEEEMQKWSFGNAVIFSFTVITTIGYGHIAPETFYGRLFVIFYGLIGVPLTLLTIADMGMFLSMCLRKLLSLLDRIHSFFCKLSERWRKPSSPKNPEIVVTGRDGAMSTARAPTEDGEEEPENEGGRKTSESVALAITFAVYLAFGAKILSVYEPEMDFFKALYFNFVTLTTIGLGDFVPKSFDYLFVTLCYIGVGLALTTMVIEIAADLLKKLHYVGRKMENMSNAVVWFGGKKMTMKSLVKHLGDQFNIDESDMANFNIDEFVDNAIKVQAGEIKTLRKPQEEEVVFRGSRSVSYSNLRKSSESTNLQFVDDRFSKQTALEGATLADTSRTVDTLHLREPFVPTERGSNVPKLDLDYPFLTDSSLPTSFDEEYLKTMTFSRRNV